MPVRMSRSAQRLLFNAVAFGAGVVLFVVVVRLSGRPLAELLGRAVNARPPFLIAVVATLFVQAAIVARRWEILFGDAARPKAGSGRGFFFYASNMGLLMTSILPVVGNIGTVAASAKLERDVPVSRTVYAAAQGYAAGFVILSAMLVPSALSVLHLVGRTAGAAGLVLAAAALIAVSGRFYRFLWERMVAVLARIPRLGPRLAGFPLPEPADAGRIIRWSLAAYAVVFVRHAVVLWAFDIPVDLLGFSLVYPIGYAVSSLGVTPGNLGTSELGWFGALSAAGLDPANAALYAFGQRVLNIGAVLVLAAVSAVLYQIARRRR